MDRLPKRTKSFKGLFIAGILGMIAVGIQVSSGIPILDPLLLALVFGIITNSFFKFNDDYKFGFLFAPSIFIPIGVIFYGAANLNFQMIHNVEPNNVLLIIIVLLIYTITTLILASIFKIKDKVSFLLVTGSSICGASAIAITSKSIDAEPDDISLSLIPIFVAALIGLFVILPFVHVFFNLSNIEYGVLSGTVMQFTGFVKAAVTNFPKDIQSTALSVKALRYMGLLFFIPLFSSFSRGKFYIPWFLWAFLFTGILFSLLPTELTTNLRPVCVIILRILWSMAMAAIGLNANLKKLFTKEGLISFTVCFSSFLIAVSIFLTGIIIGR